MPNAAYGVEIMERRQKTGRAGCLWPQGCTKSEAPGPGMLVRARGRRLSLLQDAGARANHGAQAMEASRFVSLVGVTPSENDDSAGELKSRLDWWWERAPKRQMGVLISRCTRTLQAPRACEPLVRSTVGGCWWSSRWCGILGDGTRRPTHESVVGTVRENSARSLG